MDKFPRQMQGALQVTAGRREITFGQKMESVGKLEATHQNGNVGINSAGDISAQKNFWFGVESDLGKPIKIKNHRKLHTCTRREFWFKTEGYQQNQQKYLISKIIYTFYVLTN